MADRTGFGDLPGNRGLDLTQGYRDYNPEFDKAFVKRQLAPYEEAGLTQKISDLRGKSDTQLRDMAANAVIKLAFPKKSSSGGSGSGGGGSTPTPTPTPTPNPTPTPSAPSGTRSYTVKAGDTWKSIAAKAGLTLKQFYALNPRLAQIGHPNIARKGGRTIYLPVVKVNTSGGSNTGSTTKSGTSGTKSGTSSSSTGSTSKSGASGTGAVDYSGKPLPTNF